MSAELLGMCAIPHRASSNLWLLQAGAVNDRDSPGLPDNPSAVPDLHRKRTIPSIETYRPMQMTKVPGGPSNDEG